MSLENRVQMNTSGIRDAAMKIKGAQIYFNELEEAWHDYTKSTIVNDLRLELGKGVAGINGFEGGWRRLCKGDISGEVAMGYEF